MVFIHSDHLGTPRAVSKPNGPVVWNGISDAFWDSAPNKDTDGDGNSFTLNLRYPGQYFDSEIGTSYNYFRNYDPTTGRYTTNDPIGLEGGLNPYFYANANPVVFMDPTGLIIPGSASGPPGGGAAEANSGRMGGIACDVVCMSQLPTDKSPQVSASAMIGFAVMLCGDPPNDACDEDRLNVGFSASITKAGAGFGISRHP